MATLYSNVCFFCFLDFLFGRFRDPAPFDSNKINTISISCFFVFKFFNRDEILTRPIFGNRIQQPHLVANNAQKANDDTEPKDLRPEDLLSVEEEMDDSEIDDYDSSIVPKDEPIDIDDMEEIGCDDDNDRNE